MVGTRSVSNPAGCLWVPIVVGFHILGALWFWFSTFGCTVVLHIQSRRADEKILDFGKHFELHFQLYFV